MNSNSRSPSVSPTDERIRYVKAYERSPNNNNNNLTNSKKKNRNKKYRKNGWEEDGYVPYTAKQLVKLYRTHSWLRPLRMPAKRASSSNTDRRSTHRSSPPTRGRNSGSPSTHRRSRSPPQICFNSKGDVVYINRNSPPKKMARQISINSVTGQARYSRTKGRQESNSDS